MLTRLPPPHRLDPTVVIELLDRWFSPAETLAPSSLVAKDIVASSRRDRRAMRRTRARGAVYDALVGLTAAEAGETLVTRDERAARTYGLVGAPFGLMR